jgi:uncharacterized PurR-regulated membrane protein YhhQ (DUF165 family)
MRISQNTENRLYLGVLASALYILSIYLANWLIVRFGLVPVGFGLYAPAGVFVAGAAFVLRDAVQEELGIPWVLLAIAAGAVLSTAVAPLRLAFASGFAFLVSELADFAVYTPIRRRSWTLAAVLSNTVGAVVDSLLFLWLAFGTIANVAGLILGKWYVTLPIVIWWGVRKAKEARA